MWHLNILKQRKIRNVCLGCLGCQQEQKPVLKVQNVTQLVSFWSKGLGRCPGRLAWEHTLCPDHAPGMQYDSQYTLRDRPRAAQWFSLSCRQTNLAGKHTDVEVDAWLGPELRPRKHIGKHNEEGWESLMLCWREGGRSEILEADRKRESPTNVSQGGEESMLPRQWNCLMYKASAPLVINQTQEGTNHTLSGSKPSWFLGFFFYRVSDLLGVGQRYNG